MVFHAIRELLGLGLACRYNFLHQRCRLKQNKQTYIKGKIISQALRLEYKQFDFAHGAGRRQADLRLAHMSHV